jgi:hypothetical protein
MNGFDYLRSANEYYQARTPRSALKAMEIGLLPPEAYIYKTNSVKPVNEEPIDLQEVERILSNEDNDLNTNLLLMSILDELLANKDPEIALFGAESINAIENRYNSSIEKFKSKLDGNDPGSARRGIARQFYELARINEERPAIRRFYLVESYSYLKTLFRNGNFTKPDLTLTVEVLLSLDLPDRARFILERIKGTAQDDPDILMLRARVEFKDRQFERVAEIAKQIRTGKFWVTADEWELVKLWTEVNDE